MRIHAWPGSLHYPVDPGKFQAWVRNARLGIMVGWAGIGVPIIGLGFEGQQVVHAFMPASWTMPTMFVCWAGLRMDDIARRFLARSGQGFPIPRIPLPCYGGGPRIRPCAKPVCAGWPPLPRPALPATSWTCEVECLFDGVLRSLVALDGVHPMEADRQIQGKCGARGDAGVAHHGPLGRAGLLMAACCLSLCRRSSSRNSSMDFSIGRSLRMWAPGCLEINALRLASLYGPL